MTYKIHPISLQANKGFGQYTDSPHYRNIAKKVNQITRKQEALWTQFNYSGSIKKGKVSPPRFIKDGIQRPPYASHVGQYLLSKLTPNTQMIKTEQEIQGIRHACSIARDVLDKVGLCVQRGVCTDELDKIAHKEIEQRGAYPSPLRYRGFPKSICTSINEVICHGIPDSTILNEGDIINIDVSVYVNGFHGDCSETFAVGKLATHTEAFVNTTYNIFNKVLSVCKPGQPLNIIGQTTHTHANMFGVSILDGFCGHGIGRNFHELPNIYHTYNEEEGEMLPGMVFTVEPALCEGNERYVRWPDDWTIATQDGSLSAQFEHTILITEEGIEILTKKTPNSPFYIWEKTHK